MVPGLEQLRANYRTLLSPQQSVGHTGKIPLSSLGTLAQEWLRLGRALQARKAGQQLRWVAYVIVTSSVNYLLFPLLHNFAA